MNLLNCFKNLILDNFHHFYIEYEWKRTFNRNINWDKPEDLNEKIQWLVRFSDTTLWTICSDKYLVRDFVRERGLEDCLIPIFGVWKNANDIDYNSLPEEFVLKCNHDSGSTIIVNKKKGFDKIEINKYLNKHLKKKFGYTSGEMHYNKINPLIIAEERLVFNKNEISSSIIDYKVWCFDGKPHSVLVCSNRTESSLDLNVYDLDWHVRPDACVYSQHYHDGKGIVPKPERFEEMINAASILSKGFPEVRVDFYEINGRIYFGEMTFTSLCGFMTYFSEAYLKELGDMVKLPNKK